jgi:hypothetical protein
VGLEAVAALANIPDDINVPEDIDPQVMSLNDTPPATFIEVEGYVPQVV